MRKGKTKLGVDISETQGMRDASPSRVWVAVLDRGRAIFFQSGKRQGLPSLVKEFQNAEGRARGRDLVSDRPGRSFDSHTQSRHSQTAAPRHALQSHLAPQEKALQQLDARVAVFLQAAAQNRELEELVIVAEPHLLGNFRASLSPKVRKLVRRELHEDWAHLKGTRLARRVRETALSAFENAKEKRS